MREGKVIGIICIARDITDRIHAEEAKRKSEKKYRDLYDFLPIPVFEMDFEANITSANRAIYETFGGAEEDLKKGYKGWDILSPEAIVKSSQNIQRLLKGEQVIATEYTLKRLDGSEFPAIVISSLIYIDDKPVGLRGAIVDITDRIKGVDQLRKALGGTVRAIASLVETKDPYTAGHQRRVADMAHAIAGEMGLAGEQIEGLGMAGTIHDIGKISVPAEILSMPRKLTDLEFSLIKTHAQSGYDILKDIEFPWPVARMVLEHHERMNGSGYPNGLTGDNILLESRILAVADVVEAMATHRPYRPALGLDVALEEITRNKGLLYDTNAVDACLRLFKEKGYKIKE